MTKWEWRGDREKTTQPAQRARCFFVGRTLRNRLQGDSRLRADFLQLRREVWGATLSSMHKRFSTCTAHLEGRKKQTKAQRGNERYWSNLMNCREIEHSGMVHTRPSIFLLMDKWKINRLKSLFYNKIFFFGWHLARLTEWETLHHAMPATDSEAKLTGSKLT